MLLKIYSIRDAKAENFNPPFYAQTHGIAERNFRQLVNDEKSQVNKYPTDFDLYYIGEFDDNSGKIQSLDTPQHQIKAVQLVEQPSVNFGAGLSNA